MSVNVYTIDVEYLTRQSVPRTLSIAFMAEDKKDALNSSRLFWENRNKTFNEQFNTLLCLKVGLERIGFIDSTGILDTSFLGHIYEYKSDTAGMPFNKHINRSLVSSN